MIIEEIRTALVEMQSKSESWEDAITTVDSIFFPIFLSKKLNHSLIRIDIEIYTKKW